MIRIPSRSEFSEKTDRLSGNTFLPPFESESFGGGCFDIDLVRTAGKGFTDFTGHF